MNYLVFTLRSSAGAVTGHVLVDDCDSKMFSKYRWRINKHGYVLRDSYSGGKKKTVYLHREILDLTDRTMEGDHINHNRLDNRRTNLRAVTHKGNMQNRPSVKGSKSQYRGVCWDKSRHKWFATVKANGKRYCFGYFASEEAAADAARVGRSELLPFSVEST